MLIPLALAAGLNPMAPMTPMAQDSPKEFGRVQWQRRLAPALEEASRADKPVLLLFQEVPG